MCAEYQRLECLFLPEIWLSVPEVILEIFLNMMRKICVYLPPN